MLTVDQALELVLQEAAPRIPRQQSAVEAVGQILAEDVQSDIDSPPHDKSLVDGYAVRAADVTAGTVVLSVVEQVPAGAWPQRRVSRGEATRIMTGAPIPAGADAVVMLEATEDLEHHQVRVAAPQTVPGDQLLAQGALFRRGEVVVPRGTRLRGFEVGLLAEVGRSDVALAPSIRVAVLVTGNELVPTDQFPDRGKIRNSNGPLLRALVTGAAATPIDLGIAGDTREALRERILYGLETERADVMLLSGGVSVGDLDLVPTVLQELQVDQVFHRVRLKPGKPLWFGVRRREVSSQLVFGLPGNPLSAAVCFELFVRPALGRLAGEPAPPRRAVTARLAAPFRQRGDRPTYHPARLISTSDGITVQPVAWRGSSDLRGFAQGNALVLFPAGERDYRAGDAVEATPLS